MAKIKTVKQFDKDELLILLGQASGALWNNKPVPNHETLSLAVGQALTQIANKGAEIKTEWKSIKTAPETGESYLGIICKASECSEPFICYFDVDDGHICLKQTEILPHKPTHWMPLPKPPTNKESK